ncbi:DnaA ATPase domain-containing protein [Tissierella sp.]|uniref:DnaA ATPase domain-containing protein n=1 Tax=Tissierella sp. TaxID=41274 RepID=UPI002861CB37|nr:DnaA/Hda family protein [Tissierella sp.]MDR7856035.1 DnaA/Hda family protein [Tissierella sp.]
MEVSEQSEKLTFNCPYENCDGSGLILNIELNTATMCKCYYDQIMDKKLQFANIPEEFKELTVNSFEIDCYSTDVNRSKAATAKKVAVNFIKNYNRFKDEGKGLYFYSEIKGSGKTRLMASIGNALIKTKRIGVKYITTIDLLNEIKKTFNKDSKITESDLINSIKEVEVLILDDVGVEDPSAWVKTTFYSILNGRMIGKKVTLFTSNSTIDELRHDDRIRNRIEKMAIPVHFPEESIRTKIAKSENEELQRLLLE